jgi:hypothetical protein
VKILDFGVALYEGARAGDAGLSNLTRSGLLVGTVGYMSPEQLLGQPSTAQSDLFAFGVVMHEMLTGGHPFRRPTVPETQTAVLREDPVPLARAAPGLAPSAARIIERCLQKQPADRPESARDIAFFLEVTGATSEAALAGEGGIEVGALRQLRARILAVSCTLLLLMTAAMWGYVRVMADRAADDVLEADLQRAERVVRQLHEAQITRLWLTARLVASFPELKALFGTDVATIQDFLLGYQQRVPGAPLLVALGPEGTVLARTDAAVPDAGESWLAAIVANPGQGAVMAIGDRPHLAVAVASEAGGTVFGYLAAVEPVNQTFAEALSEATQDEVVLLSRRDLLASTLREVQTPWRSLDDWHAAGGRVDRPLEVRIGTVRFTAREVALTGEPAVSVIVIKSRDEAVGPYLRIQRGLLVIGAVALAGAMLGGLWFWRMT